MSDPVIGSHSLIEYRNEARDRIPAKMSKTTISKFSQTKIYALYSVHVLGFHTISILTTVRVNTPPTYTNTYRVPNAVCRYPHVRRTKDDQVADILAKLKKDSMQVIYAAGPVPFFPTLPVIPHFPPPINTFKKIPSKIS